MRNLTSVEIENMAWLLHQEMKAEPTPDAIPPSFPVEATELDRQVALLNEAMATFSLDA